MEHLAIIFIGNFFIMLATNFLSLFLANLLLEQTPIWKHLKAHFFANSFLLSLLISLISLIDLSKQAQIGPVVYSLIFLVQFVGGYLLIQLFYPMASKAQNLFTQTISASILTVFDYLLLSLTFSYIQSLPRAVLLFASIPLSFIEVGAAVLFCYFVRKSQIVAAIRRLFDYSNFMWIFTGSFFVSELFVYQYFFFNNNERQANSWWLALTYLILLLIFGLWTLGIDQKKRWEHTQLMLVQQQNYLKQMEDVQREIRSVHHDYKNMIAGIYLHASEGNTEEIQRFLSGKFFQLDHQIEEKLKQQNQLLLIENIEIKGLLISKMAKAEAQGITVHLEISDMLQTFPMEESDLLRILGIFLDNAIEAVTDLTRLSPEIVIMIAQEEQFVIRIKNPNEQQIYLHELMQPNFSTKGKTRGFGLANVRKILMKYPDARNNIDLQNDQFIQTLTIEKE